jgi:hypothetical protein
VWVEPVTTIKLLGYPHSPLQREFCTEGLLARHALCTVYMYKYAWENIGTAHAALCAPGTSMQGFI